MYNDSKEPLEDAMENLLVVICPSDLDDGNIDSNAVQGQSDVDWRGASELSTCSQINIQRSGTVGTLSHIFSAKNRESPDFLENPMIFCPQSKKSHIS